MECINNDVLLNLKNRVKKGTIILSIIGVFIMISFILLLIVSNREFKQLIIFIFTFIFAILINIFFFILLEYLFKTNSKYKLYKSLYESNKNIICCHVISYEGEETFNKVLFNSYKAECNGKIIRILLDINYNINCNTNYSFLVNKNVVVSYEKN